MKTVKTLIAVVVATIAFNASAINTGLNGVTSGKQADAINNAFGNSYMSAKNNQATTKAQNQKAAKQAQVAANNALAAARAPIASQNPSVSASMSGANIQGGIATTQANITNTTTVNPVGAHPVSGYAPQPGAYSVPTPTPNAPKMVAAPTAPLSSTTVANTTSPAALQAALTAAKMASSAAPVGSAPATAPANSNMNLAASQVAPNTPVQVGNVSTTAGAIAAIDPNAQISMPINSVFSAAPRSNHNDRSNGSRSEGHNGRGAENAHSSAFGGHGYGHDNSKSEGFGGHSHFH